MWPTFRFWTMKALKLIDISPVFISMLVVWLNFDFLKSLEKHFKYIRLEAAVALKWEMQLLWSRRKKERKRNKDCFFFFSICSLLQLFTFFPLLHLRNGSGRRSQPFFWYSFIRTLSLLYISGKAPFWSVVLQFPLQYASWGDKIFPLSSSVLKGNL